ncbi:MAG: NAD(P)-dependent oxidoreductase [Planctomycetes bacterium]|nr:NAD(P)-dependent oxidoreductase [Planctomycetota bacterium]MBU1518011.1 NAD(P)-dependent oxidoreductase [Planctomycetota bacterium]MBU2596094.1 NAD(P)-dependent oxidoreductase [Planctomycetota bacterium]
MKIAVTGICGFIGRHVARELLKHGHDVIGIDIDKSIAEKFGWYNEIDFIECDLNDKNEDFYKLFREPDVVIHLAWQGLPNYKDLFHIEKNLVSNIFFIKNLVEKGLKNLSVTGTCLEYGMQSGRLNEEMETNPDNSYAIAKDTLRKYLAELSKKYPLRYKWIRLFYLHGEGQNKNSILEQLKSAVGKNEKKFNLSGGEQLRDYLPVEKVAEYIVKISLQNKITGIINCCSGKPVSIRRFVENYISENKLDIKLNLGYYPYPDYEPMEFWGDTTKLDSILKICK